jgi:adenine deaminase
VGTDDDDILASVNLIIENKGGISAVCQKDGISEILPLPIAGILSNDDYKIVSQKYLELDCLAKKFGSKLKSPFMTLSFMGLLVIPELKFSDKGLFDGSKFEFVDLVGLTKKSTSF